ncbi:Hypothetical predicted protein [Mytilus galloprovincialis]|uniref:Uncharacterized protein n=1 Tax=Mytilus galloprovincialis TaxID=29158 RepID=A0A8B6FBH5_MYTGA|nr:Hypothetical predicted protein [Mytilus galloprovincialis]
MFHSFWGCVKIGVIISPDGAPTQYKSKYNFVDMSFWKDDFGFEVEKHFFGSRHGKGPCDGESGVVKRSATVAVAARGCIISNAPDFYLYAKKQLSLPKENDVEQHIHSKRTFSFIKSGDVDRNRPERTLRVKTLKQSRREYNHMSQLPGSVAVSATSALDKLLEFASLKS